MLSSSMRLRLTLWYTGVLALVLVIFAITTYSYLSRSAHQRTDTSLRDTANYFVSNFNSEMNDENQPPENAAAETIRNFHFRDRQGIVYDKQRRVLGASDTPERLRGTDWLNLPRVQSQLLDLVNAATRASHSYESLMVREETVRLFSVSFPAGSTAYTLVIAMPAHDEEQALAQARKAFYVAIPIALLIASLGGYLLARKSLAPVVSMGEQAAHIGASNLDERIPVPRNNYELGRLAIIFNNLLARLDRSFAQQKRFMADASHELRTPVAVICGESEVTLSQPVRNEEEYRESLAIVNDEGRRLTRMVEDLFTLARADAGEYPVTLTDFYLDECIGECVRSVRSLAAQKKIEVIHSAPDKEISFRGDELLVQRMVLNLLHNAIKYTPENGSVRVTVRPNGQYCDLVISDTGQGIPLDAQSQVFERFFRVDKARSRGEFLNGTGAGLGLSIAQWVAELHRGRIVLERSDPNGTTFVISLPSTDRKTSSLECGGRAPL